MLKTDIITLKMIGIDKMSVSHFSDPESLHHFFIGSISGESS